MDQREIHYWNLLKTAAIFLVAYCHLPLLNSSWYNNYSQLLTYIAVPVFFMVNGAALFNKDFDAHNHFHKVLHLFLLSVFWRMIYLLFALKFHLVDVSSLDFVKIVLYFLGNSLKGVPAGPLWFIRALLACYIIFPVLKYAFDSKEARKYLKFLCLMMMVCMLVRQDILLLQEGMIAQGWLEKEYSFGFFTKYNPIREWALIYFIVGGFLHRKYYLEQAFSSRRRQISYLLLFVAGSIWFFFQKGLISGFSGTAFNDFSKYGVDGCYQSIGVFMMSVSLFLFAMSLQYRFKIINHLWRFVGRNTMAVYFIHYMCAYLLSNYVPYFQNNTGILCNGWKAVLLVGAGVLFGWSMKKLPVMRRLVS